MPRYDNSDTTRWDSRKVREMQESVEGPRRLKTPKKKKKKRRRWYRVPLYLICVILVSAALAGVGWLLANDLCALNKEPVNATIVVEEEDTVSDVADKLKEAGLIKYKPFFLLCSKFFHADQVIEPGTYEDITSDMDYRCLIKSLHHYATYEEVRVTIPEGKTVNEIFDLLAENKVATREALEDAAANHIFEDRPYLDDDLLGQYYRVEGYLFPDTYDFYVGDDAVRVLNTMMNNFDRRLDEKLRADIASSGYSLREIIILSSIIEKESNDNFEERRNIASVLYNRLNTPDRETYGMLQIDSTIDYALMLDGRDRSEFSIEYPSPFNTYTFAGFPAGAICNPGLACIEAAVYPNETGYYYFAAGVDGASHFFTNLEDHNAFVNSDMYKPS